MAGTTVVRVFLQQLLGNLQTAHLILSAHLAFAAFPGVEDAVVDDLLGFLIAAKHIEQRGLFEHEVIALTDELWILTQEVETLLMRLVQALVELVELHEHTGIALVEAEGTLHILQSLILTILLVETGQSQVTPDGGERRIETGRELPVLDGEVILALIVVQTAQIIRSLAASTAIRFSTALTMVLSLPLDNRLRDGLYEEVM